VKLVLFSLIVFSIAHSGDRCGSTVQTVWQINLEKPKTMRLLGRYLHAAEYCEPSQSPKNANAEIIFSDKAGQKILWRKAFINLATYSDSLDKQGALNGSVEKNKIVPLNIKYAQNDSTKDIAAMAIKFKDGLLYGPVGLK